MVKTNYHPASTARMGATATPWRCSTPRMRVRGIEGLRVAT
jgi:choline dehydrogenase-like flavoprotein